MVRQFGILSVSAFALVAIGCGGGHGSADMGSDGILIVIDGGGPVDHGSMADHAPIDGGPVGDGSTCFVGLACDPVRGCNGGQQCQGPLGGTTATATTVYNCAGGVGVDGGVAGTSMAALYVNGYCTNATLSSATAVEGASGACNPNLASDDPTMAGMDGCLNCAKCVVLPFTRAVATDPPYVQCMNRCTPHSDTNDCRVPGYECDVFSHTCQPFGCADDISCQIYDEDSNGNGTFDNTMGDRFCQDGTTATCNLTTGRCMHPAGTGSPVAGSPCTRDSNCEANGQCLTELRQGFPGGLCTAFGCDVPGLGCANAADKCQNLGQNEYLCVQPCTVNNESAALSMGPGGHGDTCRAGYQCLYDDTSPVAMTNNGGCWVGNYNTITTNNVGHSCTTAGAATNPGSDCYSPHGAGRCIFDGINESCSVLGCAGYPTSADICGTGNNCFVFGDSSSACLHTCTTPADCAAAGAPPTHACIQLSMADANKYCWPACQMDSDCQAGHTCMGASTTAAGNCSP